MDAIDRQVVLRKTVGCDNLNSPKISCENIHSSLATTAIVVSSLAGACLVDERPAFLSSVGVLLSH
jgi:hypothetical protein